MSTKTLTIEQLSTILWRANFIKDKNKIKQQAKNEIVKLIMSGIIGEAQLTEEEIKAFEKTINI